jgi:hypothetical protein
MLLNVCQDKVGIYEKAKVEGGAGTLSSCHRAGYQFMLFGPLHIKFHHKLNVPQPQFNVTSHHISFCFVGFNGILLLQTKSPEL